MKLWPDQSATKGERERADTLQSARRGERRGRLGTVTLISNYKTENSNCKLLQKAKRDEK